MCGQNVGFFDVRPGGTYSDQAAVEGYCWDETENLLDTRHDTFLPQPRYSRTLLRSSSRTWDAYTASRIINRDRSLL